MELREKEEAVAKCGATKLMETLRASRDKQIELIDSNEFFTAWKPDNAVREQWKAIIKRHYEDLLDVIIKKC